MSEFPHLERAPIHEAVIDIRVHAPTFSDSVLDALRARFIGQFPEVEEQRSFESLVQFGAGAVSQSARDLGRMGLLLRSSERREAITVSAAGFSFSKLHPYTSWEHVIVEAQKHWREYAHHVEIQKALRLGTRFINSFSIARHRRLEDYLQSLPVLPSGIDRTQVSSSFMRVMLRDEREGITARLTQVTEPNDTGTTVILDTDSSLVDEFSIADDAFWARFGELRRMKNRLFFGSITPVAVEDFQ